MWCAVLFKEPKVSLYVEVVLVQPTMAPAMLICC